MKFVKPNILFLDEDLDKSAQMLTNKYLEDNIKSCCQILVCCLLYMVGIRSKKACKYYFSKEKKVESLEKFFPNWPLNSVPSMIKYSSQECKWARKCQNHYDLIADYLDALINEHKFRHGNDHELIDMVDFLHIAPLEISLRIGVRVNYIKGLKVILPWKSLPVKYRRKDIILGYRLYYDHIIVDPIFEYSYSKRDIPEFITESRSLFDDSVII